MPLVINTNVSSLNAQRQLVNSGNEMSTAMERLSSGKRINTAADDAAGLAISNRMTSQVRGLNQAIRNANDGISLIQTAEGALDESTNILQRIRELSIQSANGIYDESNRATLNAEVAQLKEELNRIADTTTFNGQLLLDGSMEDVALQVGSQANQTIDITIDPMTTKSLGGETAGDVVGSPIASLAALNAVINGTTETLSVNGQNVGNLTTATTLGEVLETMNSNLSGVEASAFTELKATADGDGVLRGSNFVTLTLTDLNNNLQSWTIAETGSMDDLVEKINKTTGGVIKADLDDNGRLVLSNKEGGTISVGENTGGEALSALGIAAGTSQQPQLSFTITDKSVENVDIAYSATVTDAQIAAIGLNERTAADITGLTITNVTAGTHDLAEGDLIINGVGIGAVTATGAAGTQGAALVAAINEVSAETGVVASDNGAGVLTLNSVDGTEITIDFKDGGTATTGNTGLIETNHATTQGNSVNDIDISTQAGAQEAIEVVDRALETINEIRSNLGAASNRLDFTINNLMVISENTAAARSRILDADFAAESAQLSRAQVLQQASQAMLAQANAQPQQVLQLLQG
jgi:flagellin